MNIIPMIFPRNSIENLRIDCNNFNADYGIRIGGSSGANANNGVLRNVFIRQAKKSGLLLTSSQSMRYENIQSKYSQGHGCHVNPIKNGVTLSHFVDCRFLHNEGSGFYIENQGRAITLDNCTIEGNHQEGVLIEKHSFSSSDLLEQISITNCWIERNNHSSEFGSGSVVIKGPKHSVEASIKNINIIGGYFQPKNRDYYSLIVAGAVKGFLMQGVFIDKKQGRHRGKLVPGPNNSMSIFSLDEDLLNEWKIEGDDYPMINHRAPH